MNCFQNLFAIFNMVFYVLFLIISFANAYPEPGHFKQTFKAVKEGKLIDFSRSMSKNSHMNIRVNCFLKTNLTLYIKTLGCIIKCGNKTEELCDKIDDTYNFACQEHGSSHKVRGAKSANFTNGLFDSDSENYLSTNHENIYKWFITFVSSGDFTVNIDFNSWYGYLSPKDYPLLIFYSVMCGAYTLFAVVWLFFSCQNWRDLLRVQFWIGAVIFLGMLEKAMFVSEFQAINNTGVPPKYPMLIAEIVSCIKRMLARILLMIVCIGYGIVKQRLGPAMKKILGVGLAYLVFALIEGYLRVIKRELFQTKYVLVSQIGLVALDALILWWSFSYLIQTIQQMRMKHNVVKFNLYRHFSNILIIVVIASAVFMIWALYVFRFANCQTTWREHWINEAYWHILFSIVLLTIMILWRPSKNSQRYAYSPLLDADDDIDDDDDDNDVIMDNMTSGELRKPGKDSKLQKKVDRKTAEDDLKWIEDNIPASAAEKIYPMVDSDSEITPSKLTAGKMD